MGITCPSRNLTVGISAFFTLQSFGGSSTNFTLGTGLKHLVLSGFFTTFFLAHLSGAFEIVVLMAELSSKALFVKFSNEGVDFETCS